MLGVHDYGLFLIACLMLNLTPGQDTMFIVGRALAGGWQDGVAAALGIGAGGLVHTLAAAVGLAALLSGSPTAFTLIRWIGAAYLVYLGITMLAARSGAAGTTIAASPPATGRVRPAFRQGVLTNVLNPKVAVFFLAFLPQFVDPGTETRVLSFLLLGMTFVFTGTVWCLVLALTAARTRGLLLRFPRSREWLDRAVGVLFVGLGLRLALSR